MTPVRSPRPAGEPAYRSLLADGRLAERAAKLDAALSACELCPRRCRVDRHRERGRCFTGAEPIVASWGPHFGEEPPISGTSGSGTIFLANCNLRCAFCQNADISQRPAEHVSHASQPEELAAAMLELQRAGCHNVNLVSPTHQLPALARALALAAANGLAIPVVYNTNAYDSVEALCLLDGIVDVYMPDLKYADDAVAEELSGVPDYPQASRLAIAEMFRQVGDGWELAADGTLRRGLLVRVLILPGGLAGVADTLRWLAGELSPDVAVSLMSQYRPAHRAARLALRPELTRTISAGEYRDAVEALHEFNRSPHTMVQRFVGR